MPVITTKAMMNMTYISYSRNLRKSTCDYRTENYDEYKQLEYKLELLLYQNDQQKANNLQLLLA